MKATKIFLTFLLVVALSLVLNAQTATAPGAGDGSPGSPYQIATLDNLYWITQDNARWDKNYIQTATIDASTTSGWDGGAGFTPIGTSTVEFTGSYDGNGFVIDGLTINRAGTSDQGMFGEIKGATIKNLGLTNVNITGGSFIGGLIGRSPITASSITVTGCYTTGSVTGTTVGYNYTAGLIGYLNSSESITDCWSSVSVTCGGYGGGFGGFIYGTVSNCYSTGSVHVTNSARSGGFIGAPRTTVTNCYSTSDITGDAGTSYIGGFAGRNYAAVSNSYSVGVVTCAGTNVGGFIGGQSGSATNCFWDTETSGQAGSAGGTGKTTADMKTEITFTDAGWNFDAGTGVWQIAVGNYPDLQSNPNAALPVELTSFTAEVEGGAIVLTWATATEVNNHGFEVQKLTDGWNTIGFVSGAGNSNSPNQYSYVDADASGSTSYRLKQVDTDGSVEYSEVVTVSGSVSKTSLYQNYPNPFNPSTQISFTLASVSSVKVAVFNVLGEKVAELLNNKLEAGNHSVNFDGSQLTSGIYIYKIETPNYTKSMKMMLLK